MNNNKAYIRFVYEEKYRVTPVPNPKKIKNCGTLRPNANQTLIPCDKYHCSKCNKEVWFPHPYLAHRLKMSGSINILHCVNCGGESL